MDPATAKMALQLAATLGRSRGLRYILVAVVLTSVVASMAVVFGPAILTVELAGSIRGNSARQAGGEGSCPAQIGGDVPPAHGFTSEQVGNAKIIWTVARQMSEGDRGAVVGIATALQESSLRNLPYGDQDSLGLFQQRAGWGSRAARMNPVEASRMFFDALNKIKNWQHLPVGVAAQSVQRSAFPGAYAGQEQPAVGLVAFLDTKYAPGSSVADAIS